MAAHKSYRSRKQIHRTATYVHDASRIASVRLVFSNIMKECASLGIVTAQRLNPSYSLSTIKRRFRVWKEEEKMNVPAEKRKSTYYNYSDNHWNRTFTPEQEKKLADNITATIASRVELVDQSTVRVLAVDFKEHVDQGQRRTRADRPFTASSGFIKRFKARNGFKRRTPKVVTKVKEFKSAAGMEKAIAEFQELVNKEIKRCGLDYVINMDETPCRLVEAPNSGWANPHEDQLEILVDANVKTKITVMPTITAGGDKLPLAWINKSKTATPLQKLMNIPSKVHGYNSTSGWINHEVMCQWLREVVFPYTKKRKSALLLDAHESHIHPEVVSLAKKNHVKIVQVPRGTTSVLQPLDVNFNGPFKRIRQALWNEERSGGTIVTDNVERTVMRASKAYDRMDAQTTSKAWAKSFPSQADAIMHRHRPRRDGG